MSKPRVLIIQDEQGNTEVMFSEGVDVFWVCDHIPNDRVYKASLTSTDAEIDAVLGDSSIGHKNDGSSAETRAHKAHAIINGESHLKIIDGGHNE